MKLFFWGNDDDRLFGAYHPAQTDNALSQCILLCTPLGPEYMRSYRVIRLLAEQLSANGHDVLRFDWYGHGDSCGESVDGKVAIWKKNVVTAATKLSLLSNKKPLSIIGTRFSASIILQAIAEIPHTRKLILWDPVLDGKSWINSLENIHSSLFSKPKKDPKSLFYDLLGFPFSQMNMDELTGLDILKSNDTFPFQELRLIVSKNFEWIANLKNRSQSCQVHLIDECDFLRQPSHFDRVVMSSPAIPAITKLFNENSV